MYSLVILASTLGIHIDDVIIYKMAILMAIVVSVLTGGHIINFSVISLYNENLM
jgi:hypothetical protein